MELVYVYADNENEMNCSKHNCIMPAQAVNRTGNHRAKILHANNFIQNSQQIQQFCSTADIFIIERNFFGDMLTVMQFWKTRGKSMMAIFDDAYNLILPDNPAHKFWIDNVIKNPKHNITKKVFDLLQGSVADDALWNNIEKEERGKISNQMLEILQPKVPMAEEEIKMPVPSLQQFEWGLRMVKGIQVPSKGLAKDWSYLNDTYHINNCIDEKKYENIKPLYPKNENEIVIGWHGSMSHVASFEQSSVMEALKNVANKRDNVVIYLGGDKRNYESLDLPENKKKFHNYVPEEMWPQLLKTIDIALAPLATEYDKRRSWVKVLEYMALEIPWIATNFPPYQDLGEYGILVENSVEKWEQALEYMIDNLEFYKTDIAKKGLEFALTQTYDNNIEKTIEIYQENIEKPYE